MTKHRYEKVARILDKASEIYEKFLSAVQDEIIDPLLKGDQDKCQSNLKKFGKKVSVAEIIRVVVRGTNLLAFTMIKSADSNPRKDDAYAEYIAQRVEHFKDRIDAMKRQRALKNNAI